MSRSRLSTAALGCAALLLASAGGATAASLITGAQIQDGSLAGIDVRDGSLTGHDVNGTTRLQFKGTYAAAEGRSVQLTGTDNGSVHSEDPGLRHRIPRQVIARAPVNAPFTGRIQATAVVRLDADGQSIAGGAFGNCSIDVVRSGAPAPVGRYDLSAGAPGYGRYDLSWEYPTRTDRQELSLVGGHEVTQPGWYDVLLTCANTNVYGQPADPTVSGRFEARATAN